MKLPDKKYNIIYADPAWEYNNKKTGGNYKSGSVQKYKTMTLEEIKNLPIKDISQDNCVLFLWSTTPLLPEALEVMKSWGFKYKTKIVWYKTNFGMGDWLRIQSEDLLIGIRGKITPFYYQRGNIFIHDILGHSEKPEFFRNLIDILTISLDNPKKIELFSRKSNIENWDLWGLEANK